MNGGGPFGLVQEAPDAPLLASAVDPMELLVIQAQMGHASSDHHGDLWSYADQTAGA